MSSSINDDKEAQRKLLIQKYQTNISPVIEDLNNHGFKVSDVMDLRFLPKERYRKAVPILLTWLRKAESLDAKESIVRTLSIPWSKPESVKLIIQEFFIQPPVDTSYKWVLGNALAIISDDSIFEYLINILMNKDHGKSREMVVLALANMKNDKNREKSTDLLIDFLQNEELVSHAILTLSKLNAIKAKKYIELYLSHKIAGYRNEAKKAIAKFDKIPKK